MQLLVTPGHIQLETSQRKSQKSINEKAYVRIRQYLGKLPDVLWHFVVPKKLT